MGTRRLVPAIRPAAMRPADLRANASAATAAVLFGASVVAVRVAVRDVPPISLAVLRMGQGGLLLAGVLLVVAPGLLRARWERLRLFALLGLVLFAAFPLTFNIGLRYTEASRGAVMLATMPIWSALLGRIVGERLVRRQVVGVGLSVAGIALAFVEPGRAFGGDPMRLVGDALLLLTGLLGAIYGLVAKRILAVDSPATVTTYAMLFGTLVLLPAAIAEGMLPAIRELDWRLVGLIVFLGVLGGAVAFLLWTAALTRLTPTQVAVYVNLNPVVAALLAILLLGERRSGLFALGFVAVVTGVLLVNWPAQGADRGPASLPRWRTVPAARHRSRRAPAGGGWWGSCRTYRRRVDRGPAASGRGGARRPSRRCREPVWRGARALLQATTRQPRSARGRVACPVLGPISRTREPSPTPVSSARSSNRARG